MNLDFNLVYNSSFWLQHSGTWVPSSYLYPSGSSIGLTITGPMGHGGHTTTSGSCMVWVPPVGRTLGFWKTEYYTTYSNYYFTDANGTVHFFPITWVNDSAAPDCGLGGFSSPYAASSSDGSGIAYDPTSDSVTYPSGAKQVGTSIGGSNTLYDPNGNYISKTSGGTWTDTSGRAALVVTPGSSSTTYQVYDPTGAYQTITVLYQSYNIKTNFGCSGISEYFALNYSSGAMTASTSLGYYTGPNGVGSITSSNGLVYGKLGNDNSGISGGFSGASISVGLPVPGLAAGATVQTSSGGPRHPLTPAPGATVVSFDTTVALPTSTLPSFSSTNTSNQIPVSTGGGLPGSGFFETLLDITLIEARQKCK
jgi:hypothetical protein